MLTKGLVCADHSQLQHQQGDEAGWKREEDERRRAGKKPCTPLVVLCAGQLTIGTHLQSREAEAIASCTLCTVCFRRRNLDLDP